MVYLKVTKRLDLIHSLHKENNMQFCMHRWWWMLTKLTVVFHSIPKSSHYAIHLNLHNPVCQLHLNKTGRKGYLNSFLPMFPISLAYFLTLLYFPLTLLVERWTPSLWALFLVQPFSLHTLNPGLITSL